MKFCKTQSQCRLCGGSFYEITLKLRNTPLANELLASKAEALLADRFPLEVVMCKNCKHVQLRDIIDSEKLFGSYIYRSGTSYFFVKHFEALAETIKKEISKSGYVLEVGSNDGTLLSKLNDLGINAVGVEPSGALIKESRDNGLEVIEGYFGLELSQHIEAKYGKPQVITGNNVFAHLENMREAFQAVFDLLDQEGLFIFEVAHLLNIVRDGIFDTIYHEHMSYHSVIAIQPFVQTIGFKVIKVEKISPHGGSLRFFLTKDPNKFPDSSVGQVIQEEYRYGLDSPLLFQVISNHISELRQEIQSLLKTSKFKIFGYGAPAKVVTFLSEMDLEELPIMGIIDDNLQKQGQFLPSSGIAIKSRLELESEITDLSDVIQENFACFVFPWNLGAELMNKLKAWLPHGSEIYTFFPSIKRELL
jgi:SAM-dependent methyltransferase